MKEENVDCILWNMQVNIAKYKVNSRTVCRHISVNMNILQKAVLFKPTKRRNSAIMIFSLDGRSHTYGFKSTLGVTLKYGRVILQMITVK